MNERCDPLEAELAALRPVEPSIKLAERIGAQLKADATSVVRPSPGGFAATLSQRERVWRPMYWAAAGTIAMGMLVAIAIWRGRERTPEAELPLASPVPSLAFDDSLPSVWTYRPALASPDALDQLLDKHARLAPPPGDNVQTRGFGAVTMNQNSQLGGL